MRLNMKQTEFLHDTEAEIFFQRVSDPSLKLEDFHIINEHLIEIDYTYERGFIPEDMRTNVALASFTTCWARLKLLKSLEKIGNRVLYYDTDSNIYVSRPGEYDPSLGDYLGDFTDELDEGDFIVEFVSGGPKNYAYRTHQGKEECKVRGFSLNFTNSQIIKFETMKDVVQNPYIMENEKKKKAQLQPLTLAKFVETKERENCTIESKRKNIKEYLPREEYWRTIQQYLMDINNLLIVCM